MAAFLGVRRRPIDKSTMSGASPSASRWACSATSVADFYGVGDFGDVTSHVGGFRRLLLANVACHALRAARRQHGPQPYGRARSQAQAVAAADVEGVQRFWPGAHTPRPALKTSDAKLLLRAAIHPGRPRHGGKFTVRGLVCLGRSLAVWASDGPSELLSKLGVHNMFARVMSSLILFWVVLGRCSWLVCGWTEFRRQPLDADHPLFCSSFASRAFQAR